MLLANLLYTQAGDRTLLHAMPLLLGALCVLAIAYRYYSAFLAAKVAALDDARPTPAHRFNDGQNYHPTNKWVLFGHHFAAISGAGPLIGPVLAIQYGYMPGLLWLVIGVCLAGAVQDMLVLAASVRRGGKSLAEIARTELGPWAYIVVSAAILFIVVIALAGLGFVVVKALGGEEVRLPDKGMTIRLPRGQWPARYVSRSRAGTRTSVFPRGCEIRMSLNAAGSGGRSRSTFEIPRRDTFMTAVQPIERVLAKDRPPRHLHGPGRFVQYLRAVPTCERQFLGHVHHRLHHPHRPFRRLVHVPPPQRAHCRGVADRRRATLAAMVAGDWIPGSPLGRRILADQGADGVRPDAPTASSRRCCRCGCCSARATTCPASSRSAPSPCSSSAVFVANPVLPSPMLEPVFQQRRPDVPRRHCSRSCSSASCAARSPASTPSCRPARRRR